VVIRLVLMVRFDKFSAVFAEVESEGGGEKKKYFLPQRRKGAKFQ
jgi:hypothetical protein